jgi:hypothetical protein
MANSSLWDTLSFRQSGTLRATTTRQFDYLNRLRAITTSPSGAGTSPAAFLYGYNSANQRTRRTEADSSYWVYEYDTLGQVKSGKRFWANGTPVAGQQFEYAYDDIGNRTSTKEGGNENGLSLRPSSYAANNLNQVTSRTNPPATDVLGVATPSATVTVNGGATYRRGEYFRAELALTNAAGPSYAAVSVTAVSGTNSTTATGSLLKPPANQTFGYDLDGNLTNDLVWSYTWDAENRLLSAETLPTVPTAARTKVSWVYDPAGRRIQRTVETNWTGTAYGSSGARRYVYDGWQCVADLGWANDFLRQYAWGLDLSGSTTGAGGVGGLLWVRPSGSAAQFAAFDGNGNVTALIDGATGSFSAQYEYDTFGNTLRMTGVGTLAQDNGFRFSTKRADDLVGFILYEYRPYSPTLGRWPTTPTQHGSSRKNSAPRQGSIRA